MIYYLNITSKENLIKNKHFMCKIRKLSLNSVNKRDSILQLKQNCIITRAI